MLRGSIARRTSGVTNATPAFELIAGPQPIIVREIGVYLAAATASIYGLGRPAAKGVAPTSPVNVLCEDGIELGGLNALTAIAWTTTAPTAPTQFMRRVQFPATISASVVWTFEKGLYIPADSTIVLWNLQLNGVVDVHVVIDE
jgi:hypothetical protein